MIRFRRRRPPSPDLLKARREREEAETRLQEVRARTPHFRQIGESLVRVQQRNHLSEAIIHMFGGEPRGSGP